MESKSLANLPLDINDRILKQLLPIEDNVTCGGGVCKSLQTVDDLTRCRAVCKLWRSLVAGIWKNLLRVRFSPWLMLSPPEDNNHQDFFCLSCKHLVRIELPYTRGRNCWGTPFGWILSIGVDLNINLFNPLTQMRLYLPSQTTFQADNFNNGCPEFVRVLYLKRLVLALNPSQPSNMQVMAIAGGRRRAAFARTGDEAWTYLPSDATMYQDAIFFKGKFYAVNNTGHVTIFEAIYPPYLTGTRFASIDQGGEAKREFYLIEMSGDLHMIRRYLVEFTSGNYRTRGFMVQKFDSRSKTWIKLEDLGDHALFVGRNNSFTISTTDYPELKRNSIYFTDCINCENASCDMGVYDYQEETVETIYEGNDILQEYTRPLFFVPSFS